MARIKIEDLPVLEDLSRTETKGIFGGQKGEEEPEGEMATISLQELEQESAQTDNLVSELSKAEYDLETSLIKTIS